MEENKLAYICSPYRGNIFKRIRNIRYARRLTKRALQSGFTPITPHLYLTQVLDDNKIRERIQGTVAGLKILSSCGTIIIGARYGITAGMRAEIAEAEKRDDIYILTLWDTEP